MRLMLLLTVLVLYITGLEGEQQMKPFEEPQVSSIVETQG